MKILLGGVLLLVVVFLVLPVLRGQNVASIPEAVKRIEAGEAILIDVREPSEWANGVAQPALLLSLSDLQGDRRSWSKVLEANRGKEVVLYCRSGRRSGVAAEILAKEGFKTTNIGGYTDWVKAGQPTRTP